MSTWARGSDKYVIVDEKVNKNADSTRKSESNIANRNGLIVRGVQPDMIGDRASTFQRMHIVNSEPLIGIARD